MITDWFSGFGAAFPRLGQREVWVVKSDTDAQRKLTAQPLYDDTRDGRFIFVFWFYALVVVGGPISIVAATGVLAQILYGPSWLASPLIIVYSSFWIFIISVCLEHMVHFWFGQHVRVTRQSLELPRRIGTTVSMNWQDIETVTRSSSSWYSKGFIAHARDGSPRIEFSFRDGLHGDLRKFYQSVDLVAPHVKVPPLPPESPPREGSTSHLITG